MLDLFEELHSIIEEIKKLRKTNFLIKKYYDEFITLHYHSLVELKNMDFCLDYMSYPDFTKLVSDELKKCFYIIKEEITTRIIKIKELEEQKGKIIDNIIEYSTFSSDELIELLSFFSTNQELFIENVLLKKELPDKISFFIKKKNKIYLNPKLQRYITKELFYFLKFYINLRLWSEYPNLKDAYLLYVLEQKERLESTCIKL